MEQSLSAIMAETKSLFAAEKGRYAQRRLSNLVMTILITLLTFGAVAVLFVILISVIVNGIGSLNLDFFTKQVSDGGIANSILGTLEMALVAAVVAVPVGLLAAIYLSEYGTGLLGSAVRWSLDLLAQMPSIVVGLFILFFIYNGNLPHSGLAGALTLVVIMLPIIGRSTEEILPLVSGTMPRGAFGPGTPPSPLDVGVVH